MSEKIQRDNVTKSYAAWAEALQIFAKVDPDEKFGTCAEHDIFYVFVSENQLPKDSPEGVRLQQLG